VTVKQPFETVVAGYGPMVLRVCRAVLGPVDADDAWSETFLSAMKAYPELPADACVEAAVRRSGTLVRVPAPAARQSPNGHSDRGRREMPT